MVAIFIFAFISVHLFKISDSTFDQIEYITKEDNDLLRVRFVLSKMKEDLESIYSPIYFSKRGDFLDGDLFVGITSEGFIIPGFFYKSPDEVVFFVCSNRRFRKESKESYYAWVRYYVEENNGIKTLMRQMVPVNIYRYNIDWNDISKTVMLENIKEITFSFWDDIRGEFDTPMMRAATDVALSIRVDLSWPGNGGFKESFIALSKWWQVNEKQLNDYEKIVY
jgi:hypothetical protein